MVDRDGHGGRCCASSRAARDLLARHAASRAGIILLDMIMPLVNGMDTARELRQSDTAVRLVFLTSSPEFALESYEVRAFDYPLKPVTYERLAQLSTSFQACARRQPTSS